MSKVYASMPRVEIPSNSRETLLTRKNMLYLNVRLSFASLAFNVMCGLECILISIIVLYGVREFHYFEISDYIMIIFWVLFFYVLILAGGLCVNMRRMKLYGVPVVFGYTQEYLYGASSSHQAANRWEFYARWKEMGNYFLLCMQGQWGVIPKSIWTEEEQKEIRAIMMEKVGKPYVP